jgi:hypothetical protein
MEANDIVSILIAAYKDKVQREVLEETRASLYALLSADADARRVKVGVDIQRMSKLKISLKRFEIKYAQIQDGCGKIPAIDDYIADVQAEIKTISMRKNHNR